MRWFAIRASGKQLVSSSSPSTAISCYEWITGNREKPRFMATSAMYGYQLQCTTPKMACRRSSVRSRLAPPAFAREACEGCRAVAVLASAWDGRRRAACRELRLGKPSIVLKHNAGAVPHTAKFKPWRVKTYLGFSEPTAAVTFEKYLKSPSARAFARKRL